MPLIGEGNYGCVFKPALGCKTHKPLRTAEDTVGKIFIDENDYNTEIHKYKIVKSIDPKNKFTVPLRDMCRVYKFSHKDRVGDCELLASASARNDKEKIGIPQILYGYGGKNLHQFLKTKGSVLEFQRILRDFKPIIHGIKTLTNAGYVHQDIKPHNMVMKGNKIYLVDFGLMTQFANIYNDDNMYVLNYNYPYYPPEYKMFVYPKSFESFYNKVIANYNFSFNISGRNIDMLQVFKDLGMDIVADLRDTYKEHTSTLMPHKIDVFSLGIVLLELYIWSGMSKKIYSPRSKAWSLNESIKILIKGMIHLNVLKRFSVADVVSVYNECLSHIKV